MQLKNIYIYHINRRTYLPWAETSEIRRTTTLQGWLIFMLLYKNVHWPRRWPEQQFPSVNSLSKSSLYHKSIVVQNKIKGHHWATIIQSLFPLGEKKIEKILPDFLYKYYEWIVYFVCNELPL